MEMELEAEDDSSTLLEGILFDNQPLLLHEYRVLNWDSDELRVNHHNQCVDVHFAITTPGY